MIMKLWVYGSPVWCQNREKRRDFALFVGLRRRRRRGARRGAEERVAALGRSSRGHGGATRR